MRRRRDFSYLLMAGALLACDAAQATSLRRMSVAEISQTADAIVRARCVGQSTGWESGEIWTFTTFEVQEVWKGVAPSQAVVRLLGGRTSEFTSTVAGVPRFHAGEEVVLFLEPTREGDFSITSWMQGTFRIVRDAGTGEELARQDTASFPVFDPFTKSFAPSGIRDWPLSRLRAQVAAAVRGKGGSK